MRVEFLRAVVRLTSIIGYDTPAAFLTMYDDTNLTTDSLVTQALAYTAELKRAGMLNGKEKEYCLDNLLDDMVTNAPHERGQRFAAITEILAYENEKSSELANLWMEEFTVAFLYYSTNRRIKNKEPTFGSQVRKREKGCCPVSQFWDIDSEEAMKFMASDWGDKPESEDDHNSEDEFDLEIDKLLVEYFIPPIPSDWKTVIPQSAYDTLWVWANFSDEHVQKLNSEQNTFMLAESFLKDHRYMIFYFDAREDTPNTCDAGKVCGEDWVATKTPTREVVFRPFEESGVLPPDPEILKVHSCLVKTVHRSGALDFRLRQEKEHYELEESQRM